MRSLGLPEPPATYAAGYWDADKRLLEFDYNQRTLLSIEVPGRCEVKYRIASDGLLQSSPVVQQTFVALADGEEEAKVTFRTSAESVIMRPHRAKSGQAIVGSLGGATIPGVNGLYDVLDDLLIEWHGRPWQWQCDKLTDDGQGYKQCSMTVRLTESPWLIVLRPMYYREHLGYRYHAPWQRRPSTKPVAGWCSWEAYRREVSEQKVLQTAEFLADSVGKYGLEYIQIDDGYERLPVKYPVSSSLADAWLVPNKDFPSPFEVFCQKIESLGLKPGLWISADADEIEQADDGSDIRLRGPDGKAVTGFWMRAIPDGLPETITKHIVPLYRGIAEKGFKYVKTDQIRHLLADAFQQAVREGILTNRDAQDRFRDYMEQCRAALGDDIYYLASWGVLGEVVGVADACRISADASTHWRTVRMQVVESARWWHSHRILFLNDPDHVCVRTKPEWARSLLSLVSLSGQLMMLSDPCESYDPQRVDMIRKTLPPLATYAGETGPLDAHYAAFAWCKEHGAAFQDGIKMDWDEVSDQESYVVAGEHETMHDDHPLACLWAFHMNTDAGAWCVAYRFAATPLRPCRMPLTQLQLKAGVKYVAFDFWAKEYLGEVTDQLSLQALPLGHCRVIALRETLDHPQFIGSSRHVSCGAVTVKSQQFDGSKLALDIEGIPGTAEEYFFHCPDLWTIEAAHADGAEVKVTPGRDPCVAVTIEFAEPRAKLRLSCRHTG